MTSLCSDTDLPPGVHVALTSVSEDLRGSHVVYMMMMMIVINNIIITTDNNLFGDVIMSQVEMLLINLCVCV